MSVQNNTHKLPITACLSPLVHHRLITRCSITIIVSSLVCSCHRYPLFAWPLGLGGGLGRPGNLGGGLGSGRLSTELLKRKKSKQFQLYLLLSKLLKRPSNDGKMLIRNVLDGMMTLSLCLDTLWTKTFYKEYNKSRAAISGSCENKNNIKNGDFNRTW